MGEKIKKENSYNGKERGKQLGGSLPGISFPGYFKTAQDEVTAAALEREGHSQIISAYH